MTTQLDEEEREILEAYAAGKLEPVALSAEEIETYRATARAVTSKDRRVNIRLSSGDLRDLKVRAMEEGVPYQTLMASVLHKFVSGRLVER
jgi:predicted DNA binding CopG/RHH family protein